MAGKREAAKLATEAKIRETAARLFHEFGYEAVTMRQIAKAAGVSTGAIFTSHESKEQLFEISTGQPAPDVRGWIRMVSGMQPALDGPVTDQEVRRMLDKVVAHATYIKATLYGAQG
jgi:AcrR family transcriptional regulator